MSQFSAHSKAVIRAIGPRFCADTFRQAIPASDEQKASPTSRRCPDPQDQWNPFSPATRMDSADGVTFYKRFHLQGGRTYSYKHVANEAGFLWSFADYVFDGYRELSVHGNPPNLEFRPRETGDYVFEANVVTGAYRVYSACVGAATNAP